MKDYKEEDLLKEKFLKKFPKLFKNIHPANFDLPIGWSAIATELFEKLSEFNVEISQVKQKLGTFRCHIDRETMRDLKEHIHAHIHALVADSSERASETCEWCGKSPAELVDRGYISRDCEDCKQKDKRHQR